LRVKEKILKPTKNNYGYYIFSLFNESGRKHFSRSNISWLVKYSSLPEKPLQIDHKDADKTNDYWTNLQVLTQRQNLSKGFQENGTKYPTGVCWSKQHKKYTAQILVNGRQRYLGNFNTVSEASLTYQKELFKINLLEAA